MDKEHLSAEARAIRDRLFGWDSPTQAQLEEIGTIEYLWGRLLDTILERCPDNRERDQAIVHLESVREWTRKSIIRGEESRDR
ncbi:MAG: hypothetical protein RIE73_09095 [Coleofasciculus sp. C1-SOL-03]|uniref:hypothetical protein n=1 Tax=Coleofasciculus sp. C1-SOL-03 TaxID=3069522 RepID=UPI0032F77793